MHEFEVLADAVRRRLVAVLALGEQPAGVLTDIVRAEFGISQPAVSQHLKVLRENGFATVRAEGARRLYALDPAGPDAAERALAALCAPLSQRLDALHTEVARGRRATAQQKTSHNENRSAS
ncbi:MULTISPECIES: metalloregulator ArsR/SmtB family transcription factor [unclassified Microbacterium]|uniref:ArsR/SmtB family transcription factor n=1 Tax=unclassified Microbacterium TaxID=2609290 RepID=UPI001DF610BA|nr:metalloregulator ArsR/SmtB family transcription factor [Microbacterium sp. Bi121]CAH0212949.1 HTH-type transcriptional regulator Rv2034 [Microbacterium sp. Bi121]